MEIDKGSGVSIIPIKLYAEKFKKCLVMWS